MDESASSEWNIYIPTTYTYINAWNTSTKREEPHTNIAHLWQMSEWCKWCAECKKINSKCATRIAELWRHCHCSSKESETISAINSMHQSYRQSGRGCWRIRRIIHTYISIDDNDIDREASHVELTRFYEIKKKENIAKHTQQQQQQQYVKCLKQCAKGSLATVSLSRCVCVCSALWVDRRRHKRTEGGCL